MKLQKRDGIYDKADYALWMYPTVRLSVKEKVRDRFTFHR
jgi:hypothetical protein